MQNTNSRSYIILITAILVIFTGIMFSQRVVAADKAIIFSTAPTHTEEKTRQMYQPVLDYLEKKTGKKFTLSTAINFTDYNNKLQNNKYDFVFDGPHFVAWRMEKYNHVPLVRLPGKIKIVVVSKKINNIKSLTDLHAKRVCAFPSPNLITLAYLQFYPNPLRQPVLTPSRGFKSIEKCLSRPDRYAAVLRDTMWNKIKDKSALTIISEPKNAYPERTFSISNAIDENTRNKIKTALLREEAKPVLSGIMKTFKRDKLIEADAAEYKGLEVLLSPVWGYK